MYIKEVINTFLNDNGYYNDRDVEGVVFYGSYQTRTSTKNSDVDLIIIYKNSSKRTTIKGYKDFENYKFEYFERTLENLYERVEYDFNNFEDTLVSAIGYGDIIIDNYGNIKKLQKFIIEKYKNGLPKLNDKDSLYYAKELQKSIVKLDNMKKTNDLYFVMFYNITLEKIRLFYHKLNGFSNISTSKVYKIYTNERIRDAQHKIIPEKSFIELYIKCIENISYENIEKLYKYAIRKLKNVDFYNVRLDIGSKQH